jgi:pimeloyl-ACP methyl ester carboxylesterase
LSLDVGDSSIVDIPEIHYARSGSVYVAYQAFGEGPFDLVVVPGVLSNIAYGWQFESWRRFYTTLASFARVLLFDKRGTGISDPVPDAPSVEERMDDVRAVMDSAGSERAALMGSLDGGAMAALFAATYPERVAALALINPLVRGRWAFDYPWAAETSRSPQRPSRPRGEDETQSRTSLLGKCRVGRATRSSPDCFRLTSP